MYMGKKKLDTPNGELICICTECPGMRYTKIHAFVLVPKTFTKFIFSTVYRVTQKERFIYVDIPYVTNSSCKNVLKIEKT